MFSRPIGADRASGRSWRIFRIAVCRLKAGSTVIHQSFLSSPWRWMDVSRAPAKQALSPQPRGPLGRTAGCSDGAGLDPGDHPGCLGWNAAHVDPAGPAGEHQPVGQRIGQLRGDPAVGPVSGRDARAVSGSGYTAKFPGVAAEVTEITGAGTVAGSTNVLPSGPALTAWCSALPLR